jgi:hypothetical protein
VAAWMDFDRLGYSDVDVNCQSCQKINPEQMKAEDANSPEGILIFIEGCLNDFESGVSTKKETMENILDLLSHCVNEKIKRLPNQIYLPK